MIPTLNFPILKLAVEIAGFDTQPRTSKRHSHNRHSTGECACKIFFYHFSRSPGKAPRCSQSPLQSNVLASLRQMKKRRKALQKGATPDQAVEGHGPWLDLVRFGAPLAAVFGWAAALIAKLRLCRRPCESLLVGVEGMVPKISGGPPRGRAGLSQTSKL